MKYESHITSGKKVIANVKVYEKWVKLQGQGHEVKIMVQCERSCHKEYTSTI